MIRKSISGMLRVSLTAVVLLSILFTQNFSIAAPVYISGTIGRTVAAPELAAYIGDSFQSLSSNYMGSCLENKTAERLVGNFTTTGTYELLETNEQLNNFYKRTLSLNGNAAIYGLTADASFSQMLEATTNLTSNKVALAIMYKLDGGEVVLNNANFNGTATSLINSNQATTFESLYGNSFTKKSYYGGMLYMTYISEITSSSNVTKEEVREALNIKYKTLLGISVTNEEIQTSNKTLSRTRVTGFSKCTNDALSSNGIIDTKEKLNAMVSEFSNYYNTVRTTGNGEYYVYARVLAPYWEVPGSGYYDSSKFPQYYDPASFFASNFSVQTTDDDYTINLQWQDNCNFEDGYKVYIKTDSMSDPSLVATLPANSTNFTVTIAEEALNTGFYAYAFPVKNGVDGVAYNPIFTPPKYYVEVYADYNYTGLKFKLSGNEILIPGINDYVVTNDMASSIKINGPFEVITYKDVNFGGGSHTYRFSDPNMNDETFSNTSTKVNDNITSLIIRRISKADMSGIYLFQAGGYSGNWLRITADTPMLTGTAVGNDTASSVKLYGQYEYTLYRDDNYLGTKYSGSLDIPEMSATSVGNDKLSSIRFGIH
jgi:hypothetical protein